MHDCMFSRDVAIAYFDLIKCVYSCTNVLAKGYVTVLIIVHYIVDPLLLWVIAWQDSVKYCSLITCIVTTHVYIGSILMIVVGYI